MFSALNEINLNITTRLSSKMQIIMDKLMSFHDNRLLIAIEIGNAITCVHLISESHLEMTNDINARKLVNLS